MIKLDELCIYVSYLFSKTSGHNPLSKDLFLFFSNYFYYLRHYSTLHAYSKYQDEKNENDWYINNLIWITWLKDLAQFGLSAVEKGQGSCQNLAGWSLVAHTQ